MNAARKRLAAARGLIADFDHASLAPVRGRGETDWQRWALRLSGALGTVTSLASELQDRLDNSITLNSEMAELLQIAIDSATIQEATAA